ncbi:MetQ/NlpA family ABC transporter substrate-binding protein [Cupriavidus pauculus]|uniref:Metal ABC transporter substrate-binding protein n=1 Tax=Cupriavidus pauculus TaxID=82633 RepID=A0A2N5C7Z3_9BURK|nr:MetQ/NlpA family ABC transporter substrate-binding protein [Cupriavidus pauculus]PLP98329.1 metal ABC transporter substrate-binding protein [Cupriavidus pauculus]
MVKPLLVAIGCVWALHLPARAETQVRVPPETRHVVRIGVVTQGDRELVEAASAANAGGAAQLLAVSLPDTAAVRKALRAQRIDASIAEDAPALAGDASVCAVVHTVTYPMGLYAGKIAALRQVPVNAVVAIPAARADQGRALLLLQNHGLIRIDGEAGLQPQVSDIIDNPRKLRFERLPAQRLAAALRSAALVALPYAAADAAGLAPARDALGIEDARVPWANVLAVRVADCRAGWVAQTVSALHAPAVKAFILTRFNDSVRRPW